MTGVALKSTRTEHQPLLTSEGNLRFQSHGIPQTLTDRTDFFETQLDVAEERKRLEHSLLRKLDRRMSILILIYILNCKCLVLFYGFYQYVQQISTGTMPRKYSGYYVAWHLDYSCPQSCTPTRVRRRFAFKRLSILHAAINTLCWLHLDADTFVSLPMNTYEDLVNNVHRNMILSHFGKPSQYLPWCMIIWGILSVCTGATFFKLFWSQTKRFSRQVLQLSSYLHLEFYHSHNLTQAISVLYVHGSSLDLWKQHSSLVLW